MEDDKGIISTRFSELRERAQRYLSASPNDAKVLSQENVIRLVHELETYQVELELQNQDLIKVEKEREQSRRRFSDLYDFAPVGYLTVSDKGLIVEANLTAADMFCVPRGHLLNQPLSAFVCETDQNIYYRSRKILLDTREPQNSILCIQKNEGGQFYAHLRMVVDPDVDDDEGQFRVTITDITERKRVEQALLESEEKFRLLFENSADAHVLYKSNQFIDCNHASITMLGFDNKEQLLALHPADISPVQQPDGQFSKDKAESMISLAFENGNHRFEWVCQKLDGSELVLNVLLNTIKIEGESIIHGVWRDITEKKQAENEMVRNAKRLKEAQRIAQVGDWDWDPVSDTVIWSEQLYRIFSLDPCKPPPEYQGQLQLYHPEDAVKLDNAVSKALKDGTSYELELRRTNKDEKTIYLLAHGEAEKDASGAVTRLYGSVQDITARKHYGKSIIASPKNGIHRHSCGWHCP